MSDKNVDFMRKTDGEEVGNSTLPTQQNKNSSVRYFGFYLEELFALLVLERVVRMFRDFLLDREEGVE